jgi:hypothetical protein
MALFPVRFFRASVFLLTVAVGGCNLQKDIDVPTPNYPTQLVVECYLEQGKPYRLLVQRTQPFDAPPPISFDGTQFNVDPNTLGLDAVAVISGPRGTDTLRLSPSLDSTGTSTHFFTHTGFRLFDGRPGETYSLIVYDTGGRRITGTTTVREVVPIDTIEYSFNPNEPADQAQAAILTRYRDPAPLGNAYRYINSKVTRGRLEERQAFEFDDSNINGEPSVAGSSYRFGQGDTMEIALQHISLDYWRFLESVDNARDANGNPFAQPAAIKSTVQGGIGVFTSITEDRRRIILKR